MELSNRKKKIKEFCWAAVVAIAVTLFKKGKKKMAAPVAAFKRLIKMPDLKRRQLLCDEKHVVIRHRTVWESDSVITPSKNITALQD